MRGRCSGGCLGGCVVAAVALVAVVVAPLLLECTTTCQMGNQSDYVEGGCPVKLTPGLLQESGDVYTECVTVHVWMKAADFGKSTVIEILSPIRETFRPKMDKGINKKKFDNKGKQGGTRVWCDRGDDTRFAVWELVHVCVEADANDVVSASYNTTSMSCTVNYKVPDPTPDFNLSVNQSTKSITVTVGPGDKVHAKWCYQKTEVNCIGGALSPRISIDPSQSQSAVLNVPYLLPCLCVEVYYTHGDAQRRKKCLFENETLADFTDVWLSSEVTLYESSIMWTSECPDLKISASLCWRQHKRLCTPVLNSTLEKEKEGGPGLIYNTYAVDKHPDMCVQFSLQGSHNFSCPFQADMPSWEVYIGPGRQSVFLYLTSSVAATFSAQLCVLNERGCTPMGQVHSVTMDGNTTESRINLPLHFLAEKPCVQVWQSDPALQGRRILCPEYTHNRCGIYAVAALIFVVVVALLGIFIHRLAKRGAAGWLWIQKPVLLVCSSEQSAHVSAACALASILQGELSATVHMALWGQSSRMRAGARTGTGVADLGPLPWLYGQWESVRKAQGKVLIIWSPEAKKTHEKWRGERANVDKSARKTEDCSEAKVRHQKVRAEVEEDLKVNGRSLGKCKKTKAAGKKDCVELCDDKGWYPQKEPSAVIAPVFMAALACLEGALQGCKGQGVAFVYFQGLCHSRDIPKAFRGVPRYSLPQDFRGLIQELGGMRRQTKTLWWHCWPGLMSKVLSIWLARQLAQRLQTLLPQTQRKKTQGPSVASSPKMMPEKTRGGFKLPAAANMARPGSVQEHEPLHGSPCRAEKL